MYALATPYRQSNWLVMSPRYGFGATAEQITQLTGATATPIVAAAAAPAVASILGMSVAVAVPVIGAAIVGVTFAVIGLIQLAKGCGQTCIVTSQWANQAEDVLKRNLAAYMALPAPRPLSAQRAAMANFHAVWNQLQELCGQPGTEAAGVRCITDRQEGACKWRDAQGECWNWFSGYLEPIKNDANVRDDTTVVAQVEDSLGSALASVGINTKSPLLLPIALAAGVGLLVWSMS